MRFEHMFRTMNGSGAAVKWAPILDFHVRHRRKPFASSCANGLGGARRLPSTAAIRGRAAVRVNRRERFLRWRKNASSRGCTDVAALQLPIQSKEA
jgi:hypothetical protein